jgi:hypothetical protein
MRMTASVVALVLAVSAPAVAQDWDEYVNIPDGFKINFPGTPKITETAWKSQLNYELKARVYTADKGREKYSLTVVDYAPIEQMGVERAKTCAPGNANCRGNAGPALGAGYARHDERGAIMYATFKLLQRDAKLNFLGWEWMDMVEGNLVQLTNADQSRTFAWIGMHNRKLYIAEGTVPAGYPEPGLFQQSIGWVDKDGNGLRYQIIYSNSYHGLGVYPVPNVGGGGGGRGGAAGAAPGAGAAAEPAGRGGTQR